MPRKPRTRQSKNQLSLRQQRQVERNLQKRSLPPSELDAEHDTVLATSSGGSVYKARVIRHLGYQIVVEIESQLYAASWRQNMGAICAGDWVQVVGSLNPPASLCIELVFSRKNVIEKQNVYRGAKPFASNIDQLLVLITHQPMLQSALLDRYLISARQLELSIPVCIFFNKVDLLDAQQLTEFGELQATYQALPEVTWLAGSVRSAIGLAALQNQLRGKTSVITGQSGVGKSSLINALIPNLGIQTAAISEVSGLGRHSTTNSTLYHLGADSGLIDTPGVRSFDVYHLSRQAIEWGFAEIWSLIGHCRFSNCSHQHENDCAILQALEQQQISASRYHSFIQILREVRHHESR